MEKEDDTLIVTDIYDNENQKRDSIRMVLGQTYDNIIEVLKDYSDLKERDYTIIALWIIGTYFYKEFITYPYLFLNAMKGSGKSRTLRLICAMSWNGQQLGSMTEASLFRTAGKGTIGLDEFEGIAKKENHGLREVLNSGYKKGMKIIRMKKQKTLNGEEQVPEYFEPYTPIVMANIWGMEEVLGDRCITAILSKSSKPQFTMKMESFDDDLTIKNIKNSLNELNQCSYLINQCSYLTNNNNYTNNYTDKFANKKFAHCNLVQLCSYFSENIYKDWNNWINNKYNIITLTTLTTLTTPIIEQNIYTNLQPSKSETTLTTPTTLKLESFFNEIVNTGLNGRDLELFMPLFIIAQVMSPEIAKHIFEIAKETTKEKRQEEMMESKDVMLLEFISLREPQEYYRIKNLTNDFRNFVDYEEKDEYSNWLNPKWLGRALRRLELIIDKRRLGNGIEVTLDIVKAKEKIQQFK